MPVRTLPDAEALVASYLRAHADVAAIAGQRVSTDLARTPTFPAVTVTRIGGLPAIPGFLDNPRVEILSWAADKATAHDLARTVEAAMLAIPGTHALGVVTGIVQDGLGPRWHPDEPTDTPRYQLTFELYVHVAP